MLVSSLIVRTLLVLSAAAISTLCIAGSFLPLVLSKHNHSYPTVPSNSDTLWTFDDHQYGQVFDRLGYCAPSILWVLYTAKTLLCLLALGALVLALASLYPFIKGIGSTVHPLNGDASPNDAELSGEVIPLLQDPADREILYSIIQYSAYLNFFVALALTVITLALLSTECMYIPHSPTGPRASRQPEEAEFAYDLVLTWGTGALCYAVACGLTFPVLGVALLVSFYKEELRHTSLWEEFKGKASEIVSGGPNPVPEATRLWVILGCCTVHSDMALNISYLALIHTSAGCNLFDLFATLFAISTVLSFPAQAIAGWLSDALGDWTHHVLSFTLLAHGILQGLTLFVETVWYVTVFFVASAILISLIAVERYKLLKVRLQIHYGEDDLLGQDVAANMLNGVSDVLFSTLQAVAYWAAWQLGRDSSITINGMHISRLLLYAFSTFHAILGAALCLRYSRQDLQEDDAMSSSDSNSQGSPIPFDFAVPRRKSTGSMFTRLQLRSPTSNPQLGYHAFRSRRPQVPRVLIRSRSCPLLPVEALRERPTMCKKIFDALVGSLPKLWREKVGVWSALLVFLVTVTNVVIGYPLSQANSLDLGKNIRYPALPCNGVLANLWLQQVFTQIFYIIGGLFYIYVYADMPPYEFERRSFTKIGVFLCVVMGTFYWSKHFNVYLNLLFLSSVDVVSSLVVDYNTNLGLASVPQEVYGVYNGILGIITSAATEVPVLLIKLKLSAGWLVVIAIISVVITWIAAHLFTVLHGEVLQEHFEESDSESESAPEGDNVSDEPKPRSI